MLEYFVHLDANDPPDDLVLASAEIPDSVSRAQVESSRLPADWRATPAPPSLAQFGDDFAKNAQGCVLLVPSALAPRENNWLIDPQHAEFRTIAPLAPEPLSYDPRMFRKHLRPGRRARG